MADFRRLKFFEIKIIRRIYGYVHVNGVWKVRSNLEIESVLKGDDIVDYIKVSRLCQAGHVRG